MKSGASVIMAEPIMVPAVAGTTSIERTVSNGGSGRAPLLIRLEKLCKAYTEAGVTRTILNELDREFYAGEFVCLLGKSGSGKSTLLNLISGIDAPTTGDVVLVEDGRDRCASQRSASMSARCSAAAISASSSSSST